MRVDTRLRLGWCLALLGAAAVRPLPAEEATERFAERLDVRVVNVDVYVTDRKGRPVPGLGIDDFAVFQDGRAVEVTNFSRFTGSPRADEPALVIPELDRGLGDEPPAPVAEPLTVVVFIDNSTLTPHHRNRVLGDLETFLAEQAGAGVRFMIAVYNPGLEILTPVTADLERAREVLGEVARMPASGLTAAGERRRAMETIQDVYELWEEAGPGAASDRRELVFSFDPCTDGWEQMIAAIDTYSQAVGARVGNVQAGLVALTRSLGGLPGRKALLYLSDGLERRPGIDLYAFLGEICPRREHEMIGYMFRWDETRLLQELTEYANAHRVTLYALETTGLTSASAVSVEFADKRFTPSARNDTLRVANLQESLALLADETGGRAFLNANFPGPELRRLAEDFHDYYSLGFAPPTGWDGKSHSIRVELAGGAAKGASLRYRQRYRAVPDDERLAERTLATLVLGWEDNPLGTTIMLGEPRPGAGASRQVPVEIVVPPGRLGTLADRPGANQLLRVLMMAEDARGRRTPMRERIIPLRGADPDESGAGPRTLVVNVDLEPGVHVIAVALRDEINRVASFHRVTVDVRE